MPSLLILGHGLSHKGRIIMTVSHVVRELRFFDRPSSTSFFIRLSWYLAISQVRILVIKARLRINYGVDYFARCVDYGCWPADSRTTASSSSGVLISHWETTCWTTAICNSLRGVFWYYEFAFLDFISSINGLQVIWEESLLAHAIWRSIECCSASPRSRSGTT
jgi:hypothetical protein